MRKTAAHVLLEQLADEERHVLSRWRSVLLLRRATFKIPASERRWINLPLQIDDLSPLFRQMQQRKEITPIKPFRNLFEVTVPYAKQGFVDEREVLFELHPYAALSHSSALVFHGLTEEQPKELVASVSADVSGGLLPIGTGPRDWEGLSRPDGIRIKEIFHRPVHWLKVKPERFFGVEDYLPMGFPMRYTTPERTLIDALQRPDLSGGITNVLRAWALAKEIIDLDVLIYQVERYDLAVLRQRVGFILGQIELSHPRLERWRAESKRGGSSKLVASEPFDSTFDERWNISLNAPIGVLRDQSQ